MMCYISSIINTKQKAKSTCPNSSDKKHNKYNINNSLPNIIPMYVGMTEGQDEKMMIDGTLRHQTNIIEAKSKFGDTFNGKIVPTKYFGNDMIIPTLVCSDDDTLILGKPRYPHNFTDDEYKVKLVNKFNCGVYAIEISKNDEVSS